MKPRTQGLTETRDTLQRIADQAQRNALSAEDELFELEEREYQRTARRAGQR